MVVMAVTDRDQGRRGISAFVVPAGTTGRSAGKKENKLGMRASDTSEVIFEECRLESDALVGVEGEGFVNAMQVLDAGRIGIAALAVGLAQGAYEAARRYALERRQFGQPIRALPGNSVEARRHVHARRGRAAADVSRRVDARRAPRAHVG
jgi:alkylation response protein AidB-like acyl-CoA dehydrogenase